MAPGRHARDGRSGKAERTEAGGCAAPGFFPAGFEKEGDTMKQRFLGLLVCFLLGLSVGYGLAYLDDQTRIPRLERTEVFKVVFPDGTYQHLSYAEVERDREELRRLRRQIGQRQDLPPAPPPETRGSPSPPPPDTASGAPSPDEAAPPRKKLGDLFAQLFSKPVMEEIVRSQAQRQAGELTAVLGLNPEQSGTLLAELEKRNRENLENRSRPAAGRPGSARESRELEGLYRNLFTPEQFQRYEEYTDKKNELRGAPPTERELFELTWRLDMSEEQEARAGGILKEQWEEIQRLSPVSGPDDESSPLDQFNRYLAQRDEIVSRHTEKMKPVLDPDQMADYRQYLSEKDTETKLLQKMIRTDAPDGAEAAP